MEKRYKVFKKTVEDNSSLLGSNHKKDKKPGSKGNSISRVAVYCCPNDNIKHCVLSVKFLSSRNGLYITVMHRLLKRNHQPDLS